MTLPIWDRKVADISTGHLTELTREVLGLNTYPDYVMRGDYGFLVFVTEDHARVPDDLRPVLNAARDQGFDYVMFDADGPRVDDLPWYEEEL